MARKIFLPTIFGISKPKTADSWDQLESLRLELEKISSARAISLTISASSTMQMVSVYYTDTTPVFSGLSGFEEHDYGRWSPPLAKTMKDGEYAAVVYDHQRRPHSVQGVPAVKYSDGAEEFYWHGVKVPEFVARRPEEITVAHIEAEDNQELRRVMIERYGLQKFMADCGAVRIGADECGELYKKNLGPNEEPMVFVKVKNATEEPDGSFKDYFLRVPPNIRKAREAVAWTFDVPASDYKPELQT